MISSLILIHRRYIARSGPRFAFRSQEIVAGARRNNRHVLMPAISCIHETCFLWIAEQQVRAPEIEPEYRLLILTSVIGLGSF